jgi:CubicO group peptidase (beta-lactamase class C family)
MGGCGLLWWRQPTFRSVVADDELVAAWRKGGDDEAFIAKVLPLKDRVFTDRKAFFGALEAAFGGKPGLERWYDNTWRKGLPDGKALPAPTEAYWADGWLGQFLVVVPEHRLVAVRMRRAPPWPFDESKLDLFADFPKRVRALVEP